MKTEQPQNCASFSDVLAYERSATALTQGRKGAKLNSRKTALAARAYYSPE
jgi:hypothetical protein